jgi:hypothetical protein
MKKKKKKKSRNNKHRGNKTATRCLVFRLTELQLSSDLCSEKPATKTYTQKSKQKQKIRIFPQESRRQKGDMKQVPYWSYK